LDVVLGCESQNDVVGLNESQSVDALEASLVVLLDWESQKEEVLAGSFVLDHESHDEDEDDLAGSLVVELLDWESQNDVVGLNESQDDEPWVAVLLGCESQNDDVLAGVDVVLG